MEQKVRLDWKIMMLATFFLYRFLWIPISDLCIKEPVDLDSILLVMVQTADCILYVYL
ncbi:hypothetical protein HanXRQr2_Chr08g0341431 [Helianthus annuus]|uniref:Uncharacterized protein n=1 Tax=Helianthus annuus TaxID=4232 RepID=A0A251UTU5_HELAN|nr:hypothetical protein HanXRQr2_Chr08g0341431 [Helianthus annuus]